MRKFIIAAAAAASTLAVAAPASAQFFPQPQGYGYGYNNQNNYGQVQRLMVRVDQLRQEIRELDRRNILSNREADRLNDRARSLRDQLRQASYNGLNWQERQYFESRIAQLQQAIRYEANDGNRWGRNNGWGNNGAYGNNWQNGRDHDRDRDGRDDRYEDDQGRDHDD